MGKQNDVGVFQLENGKWAFRYTFTKNGKRSSKRSCKDEFGNSLNTKRAAIKARQIAVDAEALNQPLKPVERKTVAEVFKEYREKGCSGKAYQTIRKQDSLWENHIRDKFGSRYVDDITVAEQKQRFIDDLDSSRISSTKLVNCLPNGTIQTVNSFKYPSREIKSKFGIQFKYHYLRHTFGTRMAEMNTPQHLLCSIMGHGNIHVTQQYYVAVSKRGIEILQNNLNRL